MVHVRRFFAGSNSGKGFHSFFDNIIGPEAKRIYLLKGGPGTGKSSFMRYLADEVGKRGHDYELFFCSSDPGALDAVSFPELGIAMLDATHPHVMEPQWPGCRDQILSLGSFWSSDVLEAKRAMIMEGGRIKQEHFAEAFRYFAAALALEDNIAARNAANRACCDEEIAVIKDRLFSSGSNPNQVHGRIRRLFASALTPEGYVSHIQSLVQVLREVFILQGGPGTGKHEHLSALCKAAQEAGFDVEAFYYPLDPGKLLHVIIPDLHLAVLSELHLERLSNVKGHRIICGPEDVADSTGDGALREELLKRGYNALSQAKSSHIRIEKFYSDAMDFAALSAYREEILAQILL